MAPILNIQHFQNLLVHLDLLLQLLCHFQSQEIETFHYREYHQYHLEQRIHFPFFLPKHVLKII